jgi:broad specificity phosphatase PhoE
MKVVVVRHGETTSNATHRLMGQRIDDALNAKGVKQAEMITKELQNYHFDLIITSPLKRARETAEIINKNIGVPLVVRDELKERDFGLLSGKTWSEMDNETGRTSGESMKNDFDQVYNYRPQGGESAQDVKDRIINFFHDVKEHFSDKKVLIVAHGGILRMAHLLFKEEKLQHIKNTALSEFEI